MKNSNIGNIIKKFRHAKGLAQIDLASKAGISRGFLSSIETGRFFPSYHCLELLFFHLGVPMPLALFISFREEEIKEFPPSLKIKILEVQNLTKSYLGICS